MTQSPEQVFPYYRSPSSIRDEVFSHRMRGLDEDEVREYLSLLADQVEATDRERESLRAENERLRRDLENARASGEGPAADEINPQAVLLFSQAQQVADQLVEEAVTHARDLMTSARNQQREILEQAHRAAEEAARKAGDAAGRGAVLDALDGGLGNGVVRGLPGSVTGSPSGVGGVLPATGYSTPVPEIEYVRTFARVAQVQLRSVLDALAEQVDRLGEVPGLDRDPDQPERTPR